MNVINISLSLFIPFFAVISLLILLYIRRTEALLPLGTLEDRNEARAQYMMLHVSMAISVLVTAIGMTAFVAYWLLARESWSVAQDIGVFLVFPLLFGAVGAVFISFAFNEGRKASVARDTGRRVESFAQVIRWILSASVALQLGYAVALYYLHLPTF